MSYEIILFGLKVTKIRLNSYQTILIAMRTIPVLHVYDTLYYFT